jgi:hypothetical protein
MQYYLSIEVCSWNQYKFFNLFTWPNPSTARLGVKKVHHVPDSYLHVDPTMPPFSFFLRTPKSTARVLSSAGNSAASTGAVGNSTRQTSTPAGTSLAAEDSSVIQDLEALSVASTIIGNASFTAAEAVEALATIRDQADAAEGGEW